MHQGAILQDRQNTLKLKQLNLAAGVVTRNQTLKQQSTAEQSSKYQWSREQIAKSKLDTRQIPTSLPDFDQYSKQILRNPPSPRVGDAFKYHKKIPTYSHPGPGWGDLGFNW